MSRRALPYRVPSAESVTAESWALLIDSDEIPLPDAIPDWDYQMDLQVGRGVTLDLDRIRAEAKLPPEAALNLVVVWTATGSNLRALADRVRIEGAGTGTVGVSARLKGSDLGGRLLLDTAVVLADNIIDGNPFAAHRAGSVLWSDRRTVRLQGDAPQFPMAVHDFSKTSFANGAGWHLQIGGNLDAAAMGSLLLLINEQNKTVAEAFKNAARPRPVDRAVISTVYSDVARTMMQEALRHPEFTDEAEFSDDSLGATLSSLFHHLFPGTSIADIRLRAEQSPSLFASELQAAVKIFEGV